MYRVTGQQIVSPSDYEVIATLDPTKATLTLTSCHPKYTARERIIITSELDVAASTGPVGAAVLNYGRPIDGTGEAADRRSSTRCRPTRRPTDVDDPTSEPAAVGADDDPSTVAQVGSDAVNTGIADAFDDGWFSDPNANGQVALWGSCWRRSGSCRISSARRPSVTGSVSLVGIVPFVIVVYFFFQNVNRLLPPQPLRRLPDRRLSGR